MEFTIKERLILGGVLPKEGKDYVTLTLATNLSDKLRFSSEEIEEFGIAPTAEGKNLTWKPDAPVKEIPIGSKTSQMVKDAIVKLEKDNKLTIDFLSLYRKFVGEPTIED